MSKGKYSPTLTRAMIAAHDDTTFVYNAYKWLPPPWPGRENSDETVHFGGYDKDG